MALHNPALPPRPSPDHGAYRPGNVCDLEMLLAEREIYRALVRFARAMDQRDWHALEAIVLPRRHGRPGPGPVHGREAIVA